MKSTKRITHQRITAIMLIFAVLASYLLINIFRIDYIKYEYYKDKTYDQVTTSSTLAAERGKIYDSNMNVLAESRTEWRIFVSTREIRNKSKNSGLDYARIIAD